MPGETFLRVDSLQQYASIGGLQPAVVSEVSPDSIDVLLSSGDITQIEPAGWKWTARRISSELRTGDVVYVDMKAGDISTGSESPTFRVHLFRWIQPMVPCSR